MLPRTRPVSVAEPAASFTGRPRARSRRPGRGRPCATACGLVHLLAVHERAVASSRASSTHRVPSRSKARACTCDTNVSNASGTVQPPPRPSVTSPSTGNAAPASAAGSTTTSRHGLRPRARAGAGAAAARRATVRRSRCGRGRAAQLARDDPHHAREEEVEQREQAELQEREYRVGHRPLRLLVADRGCTDDDHVAVGERVLLHLDAVHLRAVQSSSRSTTSKPYSSRRTSAWWRDDLRVGERDRRSRGAGRCAPGSSPSAMRRAVGEDQRAAVPGSALRRSSASTWRSPTPACGVGDERHRRPGRRSGSSTRRALFARRCRRARERARRGSRRSARCRRRRAYTMKWFGTTVPRTPSVRPASSSRASRRPISTGCRPLRNALPNAPSTSRSSRRSNRWSPIAIDRNRWRSGLPCRSLTREWRNWQTRRIQVPVPARAWGFKSPLAHSSPGWERSRTHGELPTSPSSVFAQRARPR